jgi:hypothetical protein
MPNSPIKDQCSLLNHLTTIKLALELLEREPSLSGRQRALLRTALSAADEVVLAVVGL